MKGVHVNTRALGWVAAVCGLWLLRGLAGEEDKGQKSASTPGLAEQLRWASAHAGERPPNELLVRVRPEDKPRLLAQFHRCSCPAEKVPYAWLLAYIGDDEAFRALEGTFRGKPGEPPLDFGVLGSFSSMMEAVGVMAQTNELAFGFLKKAIRPDWWRKERKWRVTEDDPAAIPTVVSQAIWALGLTGRREADEMVLELRRDERKYIFPEDPKRFTSFRTDIYIAKRYLEVSKRIGLQAFREGLFGPEFTRLSLAWRLSPEGLEWWEWVCPKSESPRIWKNITNFMYRVEYGDVRHPPPPK
jgi:hypothetical protein